MILSFVLISKIGNDKINSTLKSIFKQSNKAYELIFIDDQVNTIDNIIVNSYFDKYPGKVKIINNSHQIGDAESWNLGIKYSSGKYLYFLQAGDEIETKMVEEINNLLNKNATDIIEFIIQYSNARDHLSSNRLEENRLYYPEIDKSVYALIHHSLFNKVFRRNFIVENDIYFRAKVRYDLLFIYQVLALAKTIMTSNKFLATIEINPILSFNSFDFLKQWPHILNYYRKLQLLKKLNDELEYAYVRYHLYTFLKVVKPTNNQKLIRKAIEEVQVKVKHYHNWKNNKYLIALTDDRFYKVINNLENYLYAYRK